MIRELLEELETLSRLRKLKNKIEMYEENSVYYIGFNRIVFKIIVPIQLWVINWILSDSFEEHEKSNNLIYKELIQIKYLIIKIKNKLNK